MLLLLETAPISTPNNDGGPLEDFYILYPLLKLYGEVYEIPEKYLELIGQIYVLNGWGKSASVTNKIQKQFISFFKGTPRESKRLIQLFKDAIYFDLSDEGVKEYLDKIISFTPKIFFDRGLTRITIDLLTRSLACRETIGLRRTLPKLNGPYEEITDVEKYLNIAYALNISEESEIKFKDVNATDLYEFYTKVYRTKFELISFLSDLKFLVVIKKEEDQLLSELVNFLTREIGPYSIYECSEFDYKILSNKERLVIKNIDKLPSYKITELFTEITTGEYKNKPVLLHTSKPIDVGNFPDIISESFFSFEQTKKFMFKYDEINSKRFGIIRSLEADIIKIFKQTSESKQELQKKLKNWRD